MGTYIEKYDSFTKVLAYETDGKIKKSKICHSLSNYYSVYSVAHQGLLWFQAEKPGH